MLKQATKDTQTLVSNLLGINLHDNVMNQYRDQKQKILFEVFKDGLIYEEKIEYEQSFEELFHKIDSNIEFYTLLRKYINERILNENQSADLNISMSIEEQLYGTRDGRKLRRLLLSAYFLAGKIVKEDDSFTLYDGTTIKITKGMKITKVFKQVIKDSKKLAEINSLYSQFFNSATIKGTLCLSIHPLDIFTVSVNKSRWSSCFNILKEGSYQASILSLLSSSNTFVAYIKSDEDEYYNQINLKWNNKKWRALITLSEDLETCHIGREYPNQLSKEAINLVFKAISQLTGKNYNNVHLAGHDNLYIVSPRSFYNDAQNHCFIVGHTDDSPLAAERLILDISEENPLCLQCGTPYKGKSNALICTHCTGKDFCCLSCGDNLGETPEHMILGRNPLCPQCLLDFALNCDDCGEETLYLDGIERGFFTCRDCSREL